MWSFSYRDIFVALYARACATRVCNHVFDQLGILPLFVSQLLRPPLVTIPLFALAVAPVASSICLLLSEAAPVLLGPVASRVWRFVVSSPP